MLLILREKCTRRQRSDLNADIRPKRIHINSEKPIGYETVRDIGEDLECRAMNLPVRSFEFHRFTPERFHVLFNSLFKVLFNFPSRYLFAIGLVVVFSLRWSLPPALGCTLKQPDSWERDHRGRSPSLRAWHPLWAYGAPFKMNLDRQTDILTARL
jgi:hypothetical protein